MNRFKFSISYAMLVIAIIAVGLVLLSRPTRLGVAITFSFTVISFALAVVAAIYGRRADRSYWVGYALGGWLYFITPLLVSRVELFSSPSTTNWYLTTAVLEAAYPYIIGETQSFDSPLQVAIKRAKTLKLDSTTTGEFDRESTFTQRWLKVNSINVRGKLDGSDFYFETGYSLFALLTALGFGAFARFLETRRDHDISPPALDLRTPAP